ncbi:MAG: stage II sporulation protein E, partial [Clostridiaceae bacterium]|nr:stage II sporulation protein E [Clostridiaceae bacterium]
MKTQLVSNQKINFGWVYGRAKGNLLSGITLSLNNMIMLLISFLLGRVNLFEGFMPFGLAFYAAASVITGKRFWTAAAVLLGMITGGARGELYTGFFFLLLFNVASYLIKIKKVDFKLATVGFGAILLPKMIMVYYEGFFVFDFLSALFYSFLVFSLIVVFGKSVGIIDSLKKRHVLTNEELISFALVMAVSVAGLNGVPVPGINLTNVIGVLGVMLLSYRAGPGVGAAAGVITGIVVNMSDHQSPHVIGAYAFCGLLAGVFKNLGKVGAALAFIAGNALLTIYINGSTEVLIYIK